MVFEDIKNKIKHRFDNEDEANYYTVKIMDALKENIKLPDADANIHKAYLQSLMSGNDMYYGSAVIDFGMDSFGHTISDSLANTELIDSYGTVEHSTFDSDTQYSSNYEIGEEPIIVTNKSIKGDRLNIKFKINDKSPDYNTVVKDIRDGKLTHISPEFIDGMKAGNHIFHANKIRLSLTGNPKQKNNKIIYE